MIASQPGTTRTDRYVVTPEMSPPHLAPAQVLGTSTLVEMLERTALESVAAGLGGGETTVGTAIYLWHLRPAFPGETVAVRARLVAVGRRLSFELEASVGERVVATATHERAVVGRDRFRR